MLWIDVVLITILLTLVLFRNNIKHKIFFVLQLQYGGYSIKKSRAGIGPAYMF